jgi:hypothetical protein
MSSAQGYVSPGMISITAQLMLEKPVAASVAAGRIDLFFELDKTIQEAGIKLD